MPNNNITLEQDHVLNIEQEIELVQLLDFYPFDECEQCNILKYCKNGTFICDKHYIK
jgi:hypothetical protein